MAEGFSSVSATDDTISTASTEKGSERSELSECAVCLQSFIHPAKLPCGHIFCFLCIKGIANQSKRCAMCRQEIPRDFLDRPDLLAPGPGTATGADDAPELFDGGYQWFYEGRNGWWQYDERTSNELETGYKAGHRTCELLIAGFLYVTDLETMLQMRRNDPSRRRRIKRDLATIPKKGIAGLRTAGSVSESADGSATSHHSALTASGTSSTVGSTPRAQFEPIIGANRADTTSLSHNNHHPTISTAMESAVVGIASAPNTSGVALASMSQPITPSNTPQTPISGRTSPEQPYSSSSSENGSTPSSPVLAATSPLRADFGGAQDEDNEIRLAGDVEDRMRLMRLGNESTNARDVHGTASMRTALGRLPSSTSPSGSSTY